jgi:hypothetical protein
MSSSNAGQAYLIRRQNQSSGSINLFRKPPLKNNSLFSPANLSTFGFLELFRRSKFLNFSMKLAGGLSCSRFDFYPGDIF